MEPHTPGRRIKAAWRNMLQRREELAGHFGLMHLVPDESHHLTAATCKAVSERVQCVCVRKLRSVALAI